MTSHDMPLTSEAYQWMQRDAGASTQRLSSSASLNVSRPLKELRASYAAQGPVPMKESGQNTKLLQDMDLQVSPSNMAVKCVN